MKKIILLSFLMINLFIKNKAKNLKFVSFQELEELVSLQKSENSDLKYQFTKEQIKIACQFLRACKESNIPLFKSSDNEYYSIECLCDEFSSRPITLERLISSLTLGRAVGLYLWYRIFYYIYYKIKDNFFTDNTKSDKKLQ
jgi:hypothetical protein